MQGGFISKLKKGYKSIKQEIKGAEIIDVLLLAKNNTISNVNLAKKVECYSKMVGIKVEINKKVFKKEYSTKNIPILKNMPNINEKKLENNVYIKNINIINSDKNEVIVNSIDEYSHFASEILSKKSEEFRTDILYESVEKIPKAKIKGSVEKGFQAKVKKGTEKILEIPKIFYGRSYIGKNEMLEIAVKIKEARPDFDFKRYRFSAIFYNLPVSHMKKFKYKGDTKELEFYFDSNVKDSLENMKLVVWHDSQGNGTEKIFV
jgi:hypothetical protein